MDGDSITFPGPLMSLPFSQSAMKDAIERTEVYEYVRSLTSGLAQPNFQVGISVLLFIYTP
ncbi:serine/threonine-protein kinase D2-like isoform X1 [Tachysurus ichikawai]